MVIGHGYWPWLLVIATRPAYLPWLFVIATGNGYWPRRFANVTYRWQLLLVTFLGYWLLGNGWRAWILSMVVEPWLLGHGPLVMPVWQWLICIGC